ncbi:MAG: hypothetical protein ABIJ61_07655 [bacterium]
MARTNFAGGLHFNTGFPQGELDDHIDRNSYGLGGQFFFSPERSPVALGFEFSWMNYGIESRREPFSTTIPDVTVRVETQNNIAQGFLVLRLRTPRGPIRPYVDGMLGFNYLYTETRITDADFLDDEIASSTNQDDVAFATGIGGGVMVPVYTQRGGQDGKKPLQLLLDAGARYIWGGEAEYLKEGSIRRSNGKVAFDTIESKTDMVKLHVGVVVRF